MQVDARAFRPGSPRALSRLSWELDQCLWPTLPEVTCHAVVDDRLPEMFLYDGEVEVILAVRIVDWRYRFLQS
jgi:hypothetical protein